MKFKNILFLLVVTMLTIFVLAGCPDNPVNQPVEEPDYAPELGNGANVTIPAWTVTKGAKEGLSPVDLSGRKSNVNAALLDAVKNPGTFFDGKAKKNVILFIGNGISAELIAESEEKYGELLFNDFASNKAAVSNSDGTTPDACAIATSLFCGVTTKNGYLGLDKDGKAVDPFFKVIDDKMKKPYTKGLISNGDVADPFISGVYYQANSLENKAPIYEKIFKPGAKVPSIVIGKGDFSEVCAPGGPYATNEIYKQHRYYSKDFIDCAGAIEGERLFTESGHPDVKSNPSAIVSELSGNFGRYDTNGGTLPNFEQLVAFGITYLDKKNDFKKVGMGIGLVINDTAVEEYIKADNKEAALKQIQNFDEGIAVAARFAFDDPDTLIIVTSGYVADKNGIKNESVPVYAFGAGADFINAENFTMEDVGKFLCSLQ